MPSWPQAIPVMGLSKKEYGPCGWANYNAPGLNPKKALPDARIMLAVEENGKKIETARLDSETGKIIRTGPLRLVDPQHRISPPDVPMYAEKTCQDKAAPEHRFNEKYDHDGGRSSFAIVAIRVNPLPRGTRDYEWEKARDQLVAEGKVVIFGALKGHREVDYSPNRRRPDYEKDACAVLVIFLPAILVAHFAAGQGTKEQIQKMHQDPKAYVAMLESPERISEQKPEEVIAALGIRKGEVLADIGAGSGFFAFRFAPHVGDNGRVYAVDVNSDMILYMNRQIRDRGIRNVVTVSRLPTTRCSWMLPSTVFSSAIPGTT